jgi:hypothetical protein
VCRRLVQGPIKGFVGPRHFSSLGPFGDSKTIVGTTVYSLLSGLMEGEECTDNPNFTFYIPTVPLDRHRLRNVLFSHTCLVFYFVLNAHILYSLIFIFPPSVHS